ncbi:MAG: Nucleoside-diphosphate-sugar pyrophosphorylase family protein [Promethearchaeota archaeon CR_4]|nr:MAG: Nucleoside-diphosphate-sugar pyrophosphorylase family protein [Candidatus Lokiarchaeota archaeon CR_4]
MKVLILAGGFAKRMWPLTENRAKALLPLDGKPVIEHIINKIEPINFLKQVFISTNKKFEVDFKEYIFHSQTNKKLELVVEPHRREDEKLGAIGGMNFFLEKQNVREDLLVIAGDNYFHFDLNDLLSYGKKNSDSVIALYDMRDLEKVRNRFGVVKLDHENRIVAFEEKPNEPKSTLISTGIYYLKKDDIPMIKTYVNERNNPDAMGFFIKWLIQRRVVRGFRFDGIWYDIGSFALYNEVMTSLR